MEGIAGRRFVGPYYPVSGGTPRATTPLRLDAVADTVVAAAVATGADRFPVVGLSLGSAVAITAALRHPEHVSALVLTVGFPRADFRIRAAAGAFRALAAAGAQDELAARTCSTSPRPRRRSGRCPPRSWSRRSPGSARVLEYDGAGHTFTPDEGLRCADDIARFLDAR